MPAAKGPSGSGFRSSSPAGVKGVPMGTARCWLSSRVAAAMLACCSAGSGNTAEEGIEAGQRLRVEASYTIPLAELSGLASVTESPAEISLLAAGDSSYRIARFRRKTRADHAEISAIDTTRLSAAPGNEPSQWEAIAVDGQGKPCLLAEVSAEVRCLDRDLKQLLASFRLEVSGIDELDKSWRADSNSRGEGMILLRQGHLLLLKEKKPSLLVEFGPKGESALGYNPDTFLKQGEAFRYPDRGPLVALKTWAFAEDLSKLAGDASDLTLGPDGRVYLLSDKGAVLVRLEGKLKPEEAKVGHRAFWRLPGEINKAEGLAIDQEMHPWIVVDHRDEGRTNLYRLSRLTP